MNWEIKSAIYTQVHIRWIATKDLLYGTWNSTRHSVTTEMAKQSKKRVDTCIFINSSPCHTPEANPKP